MISMYLFDDLHKWEYNTGKAQTQLKSEFRKITNGWMIVALLWKKIGATALKPGGTHVFWKNNEFLLHWWHPSCCSCYKYVECHLKILYVIKTLIHRVMWALLVFNAFISNRDACSFRAVAPIFFHNRATIIHPFVILLRWRNHGRS
jgi:hypothetical protein